MSNNVVSPVPGVEILGPVSHEAKTVLTNDAVAFLASLHRNFNATRKQLLKKRQLRQQQIDAGVMLDFLPETKHIRDDETWRAAIPAPGLEDRRVEITGPVDRKMVSRILQESRQASNCRLSMRSTAMSRLIWQISRVLRLSGNANCQIPKLQCGPKCSRDKLIFETPSSAKSISKLPTARNINFAQTRNCQLLLFGMSSLPSQKLPFPIIYFTSNANI